MSLGEFVRIRDVMNSKAARITAGSPMRLAAEILALSQASDLMVVDAENQFVGVLAEGDLLQALMPDFAGLMEAGATLERASEVFDEASASYGDDPIDRLVIPGSITVSPDDRLLKAATVMITKGIRSLAVVDGDRFVGSVARADISWGLLVERPIRVHAAERQRGRETHA